MPDGSTPADVVPLSAWQVEQVRLTAFSQEVVPLAKAAEWWQDVTGIAPTGKQEANAPGQPPIVIVQGEWSEGILTIQRQPGRIDWFFTPGPSAAAKAPFALMPQPSKRVETIHKVGSWLKKQKAVSRLAFGLVLMQPMTDQTSANKRLQVLLKDSVVLDPESRDFIYQINRPRNSQVLPGQKINRISKWMVVAVRMMQIALTPTGVAPMHMAGPEHVACRLEIDVNTPADLPESALQPNLTQVFTELIEMGLEIQKAGDVS